MGGRLANAQIDYDRAHPILLQKDSVVTRAIVIDVHERVGHKDKGYTKQKLKERYRIIGMSKVVNKVLSECPTCRRCKRKATYKLIMADLPTSRVDMQIKPFKNVGIDYFGPFKTKDGGSFQILLFTCLQIRAVHLEPMRGMGAA